MPPLTSAPRPATLFTPSSICSIGFLWRNSLQNMSRRVIGGGRVIGARNSLTPAAPSSLNSATTAKSSSPLANQLASPSTSTVSLNSASPNQPSTPPSSEPTDQDISSHLSLGHNDNVHSLAAASVVSNRLFCPICNEEMVTLLQLNRHLDDAHKEIEEEKQDEVKDWFRSQMLRAKKFQPLAVLNQKLKGLEVFESNNDVLRNISSSIRHGSDPDVSVASQTPPTSTPPPPPRPPALDPDEVVRKDHWQKRSYNDLCSDPACGRRLGNTSGSVNCRHCGKLFCEEHTLYQMKLSRSAQHEPVRGIWCRVCETCYKSRDGYNDRHGLERSHMSEFQRMRREKLDKTYLEVSRLEKRLTRLTQLLANPPEEIQSTATKRWSLASWGQNDPRKALEQSVVPWQDDASVSRCPYCQQEFSQYTFRRHHCRTCGKVVCGDPQTGCSIMLGLNVAASESLLYWQNEPALIHSSANVLTMTEKPGATPSIPLDVRLCKECNSAIFSGRDFEDSVSATPPSVRAYNNLVQFERGIRLLLPRFQKLLQALQDPDQPPTAAQISDASRTRKRLMDSFTQYDIAARRIRDMPTTSPTQLRLQKAIYQQASQFLHLHMLPLKSLPKILKHATPHGHSKANGVPSPLANGGSTTSKGPLAAIHRASHSFDSSSQLSITSATSSAVSALEAEEKSLRERLIVLEEQKFMVGEMAADAKTRRKYDEVASLQGNLADLQREIDQVQGMVGGLDFEGIYASGVGDGIGTLGTAPKGLETPRASPKPVENG